MTDHLWSLAGEMRWTRCGQFGGPRDLSKYRRKYIALSTVRQVIAAYMAVEKICSVARSSSKQPKETEEEKQEKSKKTTRETIVL